MRRPIGVEPPTTATREPGSSSAAAIGSYSGAAAGTEKPAAAAAASTSPVRPPRAELMRAEYSSSDSGSLSTSTTSARDRSAQGHCLDSARSEMGRTARKAERVVSSGSTMARRYKSLQHLAYSAMKPSGGATPFLAS
eukprot:7384291-Prymnesium_polylepis.1